MFYFFCWYERDCTEISNLLIIARIRFCEDPWTPPVAELTEVISSLFATEMTDLTKFLSYMGDWFSTALFAITLIS